MKISKFKNWNIHQASGSLKILDKYKLDLWPLLIELYIKSLPMTMEICCKSLVSTVTEDIV